MRMAVRIDTHLASIDGLARSSQPVGLDVTDARVGEF